MTGRFDLSSADRTMLDGLGDGRNALIARAIAWSEINSGSRNLEGLARQSALLETALAPLPGVVERIPLGPTQQIAADGNTREQDNGDALRLTVRPEASLQVALTGHYDTVYPSGSEFRRVITRGDGALHGPGIADMKGGLSVMLGALTAFEKHPDASRLGYRVLISPDEETSSLASAPLLAELGRSAHIGMTYEPALSDGTMAAARKGSGNFHIVVRGRAAHAGRDFASGRNAIVAAAQLAQALSGLNGAREDLTINVARIDGGAALNVVPDLAILRFNVRFPDAAAASWLRGKLDALVAAGAGEGLTLHLHGDFTRPAKPFNTAQETLFGALRAVGALIGQDVRWTASGGVCEGNNLFAAGLPNIDTLGVRGGDIHSEAEFAWPDSFVERAQLSALLLAKLAGGAIDGVALHAANRGTI